MKKIPFKKLLNKHNGRSFLICCPGKNFLDYHEDIQKIIKEEELITIGSNKICELVYLDYHMFTNNDKYEKYGGIVHPNSVLMLGKYIKTKWAKKHSVKRYISIEYTDRDKKEKLKYNKKTGVIEGYYRTSGNLAIMICHLMGASKIYISGMSGFTFEFDGKVHYYEAEIKRDQKSKKEWQKKYDSPVAKSLDNLAEYGIPFKLITPTIYNKHYDKTILNRVT